MRQPDELYAHAAANAWRQIKQRLAQLTAERASSRFKLVEVRYDPTADQSVIEELPETPKSSRPRAVQVSVRLSATYLLEPDR